MKIKTFLYFPDSEAAFDALSKDAEMYNGIVKELYAIKHKLKNEDYELYYDSGNISSFLQAADGFIDAPYLAGIGNQLQSIVSNKSKNINTPYLRKVNHVYGNWSNDLNVICSPFVFSEAAEAELDTDVEKKVICICLGNAISQTDILHVIRDYNKGASDPVIISLTLANSDVGFIRWISTLSDGHFRLKNNNDFEPLDKFWKKERIYRHKETGTYWYFDFFHKANKAHYEVFNDTGSTHLGEADLEGKIKPGTSDNNKAISDLL